MGKTQFILQYTGTVTINSEYTVNLEPGTALQINWFPDNDLIVETKDKKYFFNTGNTKKIDEDTYLIQIITVENLYDLPLRFARGDYVVAGDIVIDQKRQEYFKADQIDILPDELVAAHHDKVTRVLFSGDKVATEHYIKKTN